MAGGDEVEPATAVAAEALLDVLHELAPDRLERVDAERAGVCGLAGHLALAVVALGEDGEQHVVLRVDAQVGRQVGARLAHVRRLHQVVGPAALADAVDGDLGVGVVVLVVVADAHQLGDEGRRRRVLHLRREEVAEALRAEAVHVVDGVALARQRVDEHARARGDGRLGDHEHLVAVQAARRHGGHLGPVRRVAGEGDAHVHHLRHRRVGRAGRDERHRRRRRVVGHHGLAHHLRHVRDVVQVAHRADALEDAAAHDEARRRVVYDERLVHVVGELLGDGRRAVEHGALGRVLLRARHVLHDELQVGRQLV